MSRGMPRIKRWRGTFTQAAEAEAALRELGLYPLQPLVERVRLLKAAVLWPCIEGPVVTDGSGCQMYLWVVPEVAGVVLKVHPNRRRDILCASRNQPLEERLVEFRGVLTAIALGGVP